MFSLIVLIICVGIASVGAGWLHYKYTAEQNLKETIHKREHTVEVYKGYNSTFITPSIYKELVEYNEAHGYLVSIGGKRYRCNPDGTLSSRDKYYTHWRPVYSEYCVVPRNADAEKLMPADFQGEEFPD